MASNSNSPKSIETTEEANGGEETVNANNSSVVMRKMNGKATVTPVSSGAHDTGMSSNITNGAKPSAHSDCQQQFTLLNNKLDQLKNELIDTVRITMDQYARGQDERIKAMIKSELNCYQNLPTQSSSQNDKNEETNVNVDGPYENRIIFAEPKQAEKGDRSSKILALCNKFEELLKESNVIADKSLFIYEWFKSDPRTIFALPNGVGKSSILSMTKEFFSNSTAAKQADIFTKRKFNFEIMEPEYNEFVKKHKNRWPVIYIQFTNVRGMNVEDLGEKLKCAICDAYEEHTQIKDCLAMSSHRKTESAKFDAFFDHSTSVYNAINYGVKFLADMLKLFYGQKAIVIVDDYSQPMEQIICNSVASDEQIERTYLMMQNFLGFTLALSVERLLMAGSFEICFPNTNIKSYGMHPNRFSKYFGFSQSEFDDLCQSFSLQDEKLREAATNYYNGYDANYDGGARIPLYSTNSCIQFLKQYKENGNRFSSVLTTSPISQKNGVTSKNSDGDIGIPSSSAATAINSSNTLQKQMKVAFCFKNYFHNEMYNGYIGKLDDLFRQRQIAILVTQLINREAVKILRKNLHQPFIIHDFLKLHEMMAKPKNIGVLENGKHLFLQFLYATGLVVRQREDKNRKLNEYDIVHVPNGQTREMMIQKLRIYYRTKYLLSDDDLNPVSDELYKLFWCPGNQKQADDKPANNSEITASDGQKMCEKIEIIECPHLEKALRKVFDQFRLVPFADKTEFQQSVDSLSGEEGGQLVRGNEDLIHIIMGICAIKMPGWSRFGTDFRMDVKRYEWMPSPKKSKKKKKNPNEQEVRPDLSIFHREARTGMTIELKYLDKEEKTNIGSRVLKRGGRFLTRGRGGGKKAAVATIGKTKTAQTIGALKQIGEQGYLQIYRSLARKCQRIVTIGICVDKAKNVSIGAVVRQRRHSEKIGEFIERFTKELFYINSNGDEEDQQQQNSSKSAFESDSSHESNSH